MPSSESLKTFSVVAKDGSSQARAGVLRTPRGDVETPVFMSVATQGSVKAMTQEDLRELGARIILANAYHLYLRPGTPVIEKAGGLHGFMNYDGAILTDSGGFQVMSLAKLREITEEGVTFRSHLDGSKHLLTPESVIGIQRRLGSDIWTSLDECLKYPFDEQKATDALERTMRWTERAHASIRRHADSEGKRGMFFPIIQGGTYPALRRRAVEHLATLEYDGISIGGVSVGEPKEKSWEIASLVSSVAPEDKPRYLMGVGTPEDLWDAVSHGVDMMDCVFPTRVARHGMAMTREGRLNLLNAASREDFRPVDPECACRVCKTYSRAYLGHLSRAGEISAMTLLSFHNVYFLMDIASTMRRAIIEGRFDQAKKDFFSKYQRREPDA
ncbi:MAG: tRNA guanosine(34) transglycosylase Tgt [Elusimicrobia bacterium]|nr:tRNA guanosine(34) transglycosylase Tgt [Elusimicrobiota bacterium]